MEKNYVVKKIVRIHDESCTMTRNTSMQTLSQGWDMEFIDPCLLRCTEMQWEASPHFGPMNYGEEIDRLMEFFAFWGMLYNSCRIWARIQVKFHGRVHAWHWFVGNNGDAMHGDKFQVPCALSSCNSCLAMLALLESLGIEETWTPRIKELKEKANWTRTQFIRFVGRLLY